MRINARELPDPDLRRPLGAAAGDTSRRACFAVYDEADALH
jgi:hypothetical protein